MSGKPKKHKGRVDYYHDPAAPPPTSRKPSASVVVQNERGELLLMCRSDTGRWVIPGGKLEFGETIAECGIREVKEETGVDVEITGLVGVYSDPGHLVARSRNGKVKEVRQPCNICLRARPVGGTLRPDPDEASDVRWVDPADLDAYELHPAVRLRITHGLGDGPPYIG